MTLFDNSINQRAKQQLEPPIDGKLTRRTQRALVLLDGISRARKLRDQIREWYRLRREADNLRVDLTLKESGEYD